MTINPISNAGSGHYDFQPKQDQFHGLKVGQTVMTDLKSQDGKTILPAGTQITADVLTRLKNSVSVGGLQAPVIAAG